jgi:hypothetical protein
MLPRYLGTLLRAKRPLVALFLLLTLVPSALLVAFGWRMLDQDRALAEQQFRQQREQAADLAAASLQQSLSAAEQALREPTAIETLAASEDSAAVIFDAAGVRAFPSGRLLFYPVSSAEADASTQIFADAEALEYRRNDVAGAASRYERLARASDPAVRAGALIRLARVRRKMKQDDEALAIYEQVAAMADVAVGGVPADLMARWARCDLLEGMNRKADLRHEASALYADLMAGRWRLDRATYDVHAGDARRWLGMGVEDDAAIAARLALSAAADRLWHQWHDQAPGDRRGSAREVMTVGDGPLVVLWDAQGDRFAALVAGPSYVDERWLRPVRQSLERQNLIWRRRSIR